MNIAALRTLIAVGESPTLELKKSTAEKDRACRSLCAFANDQGRQVVFGVTPLGKVVGQYVTDRTPEETLGKTLGKTLEKTPDLILKRLRGAPGSSISELAQQLDKSSSAVERAIRKLRGQGKLQRIGPAKGGHWKVTE